jgi:transcriptional regulator with XRE-family HTH domain
MAGGAGPNPTVGRLVLAARLRELRIQAGKTIDDAAAELMCSVAKISRMETGGRGVQPRDIRDLCRLYGASDEVRAELNRMAGEAGATSWWQRDFRALDEQITTFIGLEAAATETRIVEGMRVPGLLQTPSFARALIRDLRPPGELTSEWIDETVASRERRQKRIESGDLRLHAILDEAALSRPVGGAEVMRQQVARLVDEAARPNVDLQVIPFERGPHPGVDGSFQHLSFGRHNIGNIVFVEGLLGNYLLDKGDDVARYQVVFDDLSTRFALDPDATTRWLKALHGRSGTAGRGRRRPSAH